MSDKLHSVFNRARLNDRQMDELIGLAHGIIADGVVDQREAEYLQKWLAANFVANDNPVIGSLMVRIDEMLSDGLLDEEEVKELFETLTKFTGGDFELGELLKSSSLPLDDPPPSILFDQTRFCFTGTFLYGTRKVCEGVVESMGATAGSLSGKTNYLVIGVYATDSWMHSSYGRKIEKAAEMKSEGVPISIIGESHWVSFLGE